MLDQILTKIGLNQKNIIQLKTIPLKRRCFIYKEPMTERLQSLAKSRQTPVIDVLHAAIDALERQEFLRGLGEDYQRLRDDPERWEQYLAERQEWDSLA